MRSFSVFFVSAALAEETCSQGSCAQDEATMLQLNGLRQKIKRAKTSSTWEQYEVDMSKCNYNENLVCVADQDACQQEAIQNGHRWYSFRHNSPSSGECAGEHKCFSSNHCDNALIADRTNDWNIYTSFGMIQGCPGSSLTWGDQVGADVRCCTLDGSTPYDGDNCNSGYLPETVGFLDGTQSDGRSCGAGDCNGDSNAWCHDDVSFDEAQAICHANGERLCTRAEIENRDCCGTGCMHNHHMIWYSDQLPTHHLAVVSWPEYAWGDWDDAVHGPVEKCVSDDLTADADGGSGILFTSCCSAEGEGLSRDCGTTRSTDFATAQALCAAQAEGGRLCSAAESIAHDARGWRRTVTRGCSVDGPSSATGNNMNRHWTSTPCSPA